MPAGRDVAQLGGQTGRQLNGANRSELVYHPCSSTSQLDNFDDCRWDSVRPKAAMLCSSRNRMATQVLQWLQHIKMN